MPPDAEKIISGLCTRDRTKRLGNMSGGAQRVKEHPFFRGINWEAIYYRKIKGPIIPQLSHPADTKHFDEYEPEPTERDEYTSEQRELYDDAFDDF